MITYTSMDPNHRPRLKANHPPLALEDSHTLHDNMALRIHNCGGLVENVSAKLIILVWHFWSEGGGVVVSVSVINK